jgi:hypothetical protein
MFTIYTPAKGAAKGLGCAALMVALSLPCVLAAQDRDRDWDHDRDRMTRIEPGTTIPVRINETINVQRPNSEVYTGTVDQDIRGENGRLAIPRGSQVDLRVRVARDNDLVLDLDAVTVHGERYALPADQKRLSPDQGNLVGSIVGAVTGAQVRGPAVTVSRDTVLTFRIDQPLEMQAAHHDRGY